MADGVVKCWRGSYGSTPVVIDDISNAVSVSSGSGHTCAVLESGEIKCWNYYSGEFYYSDVNDVTNAVSVSAGGDHTCAVLSDGVVKCWGSNEFGQLGDGTTEDSSAPVAVNSIFNTVSVFAGGAHTCVLLADGGVKCWGNNWFGQLGDGNGGDYSSISLTPVDVIGVSNAVSVFVGGMHTCALLADGGVKCWGNNDSGQLGDGTNTSGLIPIEVLGISNAISVSSFDSFTCAVLSDGIVKCWGEGIDQLVGGGSEEYEYTLGPLNVSNISTAVSVSSGIGHTCAVLEDGAVKCLGDNAYGQLGDGGLSGNFSKTPVDVNGITNAVSVSAGFINTCAVLSDGKVKCWGYNEYGQLGDGCTENRLSPVDVNGVDNAIVVSLGYGETCALLRDGNVKCWGGNSLVPVDVNGISNVVSISSFFAHCAVLDSGNIKCWELGSYGSTYYDVNNIDNAVSVSLGSEHTCAVLADGKVKCWGDNYYGRLGDGTQEDSSTPVDVVGITNAVSVTLGDDFTCALLRDGKVKCWGNRQKYPIVVPFTTVDDSLYD